MKKFLLSLVALLATLGAWAQTPVLTYTDITAPQELSAEDAETIRKMGAMTIVADVTISNSSNVSLLFAAVADYTSNKTDDNTIWGLGIGGNSVRYYVGPREGGWYSSTNGDVTTATKKIIYTYNGTTIKYYVDGVFHVADRNHTKALKDFSGNNAKFFLGGLVYNTDTKWGKFNGTISNIEIYNGAFTDEQVCSLVRDEYDPKAVLLQSELKSGNVYTFETIDRGSWMAKAGEDYVYSSKKIAAADTDANNPFCQWVYYVSNNKQFLYNVGAKKFIAYNSSNLDLIPLSEVFPAPIDVKNSRSAARPFLIGINSKVINLNITNNKFTYGACLWDQGWNGNLSDPGSANLILNQGEATQETLNEINSKISIYEATTRLDDVISKIEARDIGIGVGYYSTTEDNLGTALNAIKEFRNGIGVETQTVNIEVKITEANALLSSLTLNMPQAGKFYRIENESKTGYLACGTGTGRTQFTAGISEKANSIFYYTGSKLVCYTTGLYLAESGNFLHYTNTVGEAAGTTIGFSSTPVVGMYAISFKDGNRSFYSNAAGGTNAASSGQTGQHYRFNLHEVEWLPIAINEEVKHATFYSPVDLNLSFDRFKAYTVKVNGKSASLIEQEYVPANTGVVLQLQEGATVQDGYCYLQVKGTKEAVESELQGTFDTQYIDVESYVLSNGTEGLGFYKALMNQSDNSAFKNNAFKAYLPATAATANARFLNFNFGDDTETAIESVEAENANVKTEIFDLAGRRVQNAQKGIYIVNGKVVIK